MNREIIQGNVFETIKQIADESVDCVITSPPYWGLRDYGMEDQFGNEPDFRDFLAKLRELMNQIRRILKPTGTVWVNLGDCYNGTGDHTNTQEFGKQQLKGGSEYIDKNPRNVTSIQKKSRIGIPERFYIQCIDDGWLGRNHLVWYKSNAMPSSVQDRYSNKWESVFFFTKNQKYLFDLDAVRVTSTTEIKPLKTKENQPHTQSSLFGEDDDVAAVGIHEKYAEEPQSNVARLHKEREGNPNYAQDQYTNRMLDARANGAQHDNPLGNPKGKNPGDVLFINPKPFIEAHFATFPVALPMELIKAGCPVGGLVYDPFFGSGTVGVAAEKLNRRWMGSELNPEYIEIARKRLEPYKNARLEITHE